MENFVPLSCHQQQQRDRRLRRRNHRSSSSHSPAQSDDNQSDNSLASEDSITRAPVEHPPQHSRQSVSNAVAQQAPARRVSDSLQIVTTTTRTTSSTSNNKTSQQATAKWQQQQRTNTANKETVPLDSNTLTKQQQQQQQQVVREAHVVSDRRSTQRANTRTIGAKVRSNSFDSITLIDDDDHDHKPQVQDNDQDSIEFVDDTQQASSNLSKPNPHVTRSQIVQKSANLSEQNQQDSTQQDKAKQQLFKRQKVIGRRSPRWRGASGVQSASPIERSNKTTSDVDSKTRRSFETLEKSWQFVDDFDDDNDDGHKLQATRVPVPPPLPPADFLSVNKRPFRLLSGARLRQYNTNNHQLSGSTGDLLTCSPTGGVELLQRPPHYNNTSTSLWRLTPSSSSGLGSASRHLDSPNIHHPFGWTLLNERRRNDNDDDADSLEFAHSTGALYGESSFSTDSAAAAPIESHALASRTRSSSDLFHQRAHRYWPHYHQTNKWLTTRNRRRPNKSNQQQTNIYDPTLSRSGTTSSVFALYALRYAYDKFQLALRSFKEWYHASLDYHKLSNRMEYDRRKFERWYKSRGRPLSLRALDHYDRVVIWIADERDNIQKRTFAKWINKYLMRRGRQMHDLFEDLRDGQNLITLLEVLSNQNLPRERGRMRVHQLQNIQIALNYIKFRKVKLVNIRPEDIVDGNQKLTLGLIWTIILHFQLEDNSNFREILLRWAQRTTDGYPGCNVTDLTTSWRDGLAFNAILHRNRPDLLDYRACRKKTSLENLEQAFSVADRKLGVARLLEPEDVNVPCPDEKSMITYLAQLYELFPNPPERNPLLDEEKIRRIDEYKELASRLLKWIKESTTKLEDRQFPKQAAQLRKLKDETDRFRTEEVPPKQHDKQRLAAVAREVYKMAQDVNVKVPDDLHIDNIDYHWDRMINALKARSKALDDELAKAERLRAMLEKLLNDIKETNARLDNVENRMNEEERRVARLETLRDAEAYSPVVFQKISEDLADIGIKIDSIKRLAEDFCNENGRTAPDSIMIREKVSELDGRYKKLLGRLNRLHDDYDRTLKRLREMDDEMRRRQAQKEAEAKLRLKLDEMKRQLDELERRIDNMGPVAKDIPTLQKQLAELHEFDKDLNKARNNLNALIELAEGMIRDDLIADPVSLRSNLKALKDQLARIEDKAARRLKEFEAALERAERQKQAEAELNLKLDGIKKELDELERRIDNMAPIGKDLATLKRQLDELKDFEQDVSRTRRNLNDIVRLAEDMIREDLISDPATLRANINVLKDQLARIDEKVARRLRALKDALNRAEAQREAEEKFNLRLDAIRRELEDLERRLDSMAPVSKDLEILQQQLAEMHDFNERLNKTRNNLNDVLKAGEDLIREDLIADPAALRANLKGLKEHLARIEDKAAKRLREIQDAMGRVAASDAIQEVAKFLERAKKILINEENVHGDLDTVNALIEQHKSFQQEIQAKQPAINEVRRMEKELSSASPQTGAAIRDELNDLSNQWRDVERLTREKSSKLEDALRAAEQLHDSVHGLLEWLADAEMKLRFAGSMPEDEKATNQELAEHEKFMRKLASQDQAKEQTLKLARDILTKCHPDAEPVIKHWINIIQSRWEEIDAWAKQRGQRLADHLRSLTDLLELVEELIGWLTRHESRLLGEETEQLPTNANQLESMIDAHATFMEELRKREPDVDRAVKIFANKAATATSKTIVTTTTTKPRSQQQDNKSSSGRLSGGARSATPTRTSYATYRDEYPEVRHPRARIMLEKWRAVWQLALDKMQRLKDRVEHLKELERLENFDFDQWRRRFLTYVNANKGRVMDFFRSIDDDNDGRIPVESFISGVLRSKFETSRLEMERVADIFDRNNDGTIDNKEYLDSLRPDQPISDDEIIQDEVQRQVSKCTCPQRYRVYHVGEGRYRFGESQKLRLVRILRSTVMVRVGGGWEPLASFLQKNDPCRAKGRTNVELREQFILPEGASQAMAAFKSKLSRDPGSMPVLGPITKIREKTDRSMPMSATGSRYGSPSDYYSESESTSRAARSRIGRLTPASTSSRPSSRSASRHGSDLAYNLDPTSTGRSSTDNLK